MPRTRKTTHVSSRTRKQTSARTLRNRGGNPATKKLIMIGLVGIIAKAIYERREDIITLFNKARVKGPKKKKEAEKPIKPIMAKPGSEGIYPTGVIMGARAEKPTLSLLYRFPFILVWGFDNIMLDDLKTEFPKFIMNAEIQDLRGEKTQYEKQKQYKTTQQCRVESDIVRLYKKNTPCVCFIDGSLKEFEFPNDDNIFVIWRQSGVSEPSYREVSLNRILQRTSVVKTKFIKKQENTTKEDLIKEIKQLLIEGNPLTL